MVFFPHKTGKDPRTLQEFFDYSTECVKKQDHLAALFYCYWAFEAIKKREREVKKKELDKMEELAAAFLERAADLRKMYNAHPVASTMKGAELEMMQRRIQDVKAQFAEIEAKVPTSDEETGKLAEKLKALSEEGSFLDDLFSPMGKVEGTEVWQERLAKGVEHLFTSLAQALAKAEAKAAGGSKKEEEAKKKEEAKAAEAKKKEDAKAAEAKKKEDAKAAKEAEAKKKEDAKKSKGDKKAGEDKKD